MEYLVVVRLCALIAQEAETEQSKAQGVTLKKAINDLAAGASEADNQKENAWRALIKTGELPATTSTCSGTTPAAKLVLPQSSSKAAKGIKSTVSSSPPLSSFDDVIEHVFSFIRPPSTGKTSLGQSIDCAFSRPFQRIALGGVRGEAEIRGRTLPATWFACAGAAQGWSDGSGSIIVSICSTCLSLQI